VTNRDYNRMIQQGRKAGLNTAELYQAMNASRPETSSVNTGQSDANGYVVRVTQNGNAEYTPAK